MSAFKPNDPERARQYFEDKLSFTTGPVELSGAMHDTSVRIIDVRARKDFVREHIPGSINLPEADWSTERGLARDQLNVVLCYSAVCQLAARAAVELAGRGYPVRELEGGFDGWKSHGLPTETGDAAHDGAVDRARAFLDSARTVAREKPAEQAAAAKRESPKAKPEEQATENEESTKTRPEERATAKEAPREKEEEKLA